MDHLFVSPSDGEDDNQRSSANFQSARSSLLFGWSKRPSQEENTQKTPVGGRAEQAGKGRSFSAPRVSVGVSGTAGDCPEVFGHPSLLQPEDPTRARSQPRVLQSHEASNGGPASLGSNFDFVSFMRAEQRERRRVFSRTNSSCSRRAASARSRRAESAARAAADGASTPNSACGAPTPPSGPGRRRSTSSSSSRHPRQNTTRDDGSAAAAVPGLGEQGGDMSLRDLLDLYKKNAPTSSSTAKSAKDKEETGDEDTARKGTNRTRGSGRRRQVDPQSPFAPILSTSPEADRDTETEREGEQKEGGNRAARTCVRRRRTPYLQPAEGCNPFPTPNPHIGPPRRPTPSPAVRVPPVFSTSTESRGRLLFPCSSCQRHPTQQQQDEEQSHPLPGSGHLLVCPSSPFALAFPEGVTNQNASPPFPTKVPVPSLKTVPPHSGIQTSAQVSYSAIHLRREARSLQHQSCTSRRQREGGMETERRSKERQQKPPSSSRLPSQPGSSPRCRSVPPLSVCASSVVGSGSEPPQSRRPCPMGGTLSSACGGVRVSGNVPFAGQPGGLHSASVTGERVIERAIHSAPTPLVRMSRSQQPTRDTDRLEEDVCEGDGIRSQEEQGCKEEALGGSAKKPNLSPHLPRAAPLSRRDWEASLVSRFPRDSSDGGTARSQSCECIDSSLPTKTGLLSVSLPAPPSLQKESVGKQDHEKEGSEEGAEREGEEEEDDDDVVFLHSPGPLPESGPSSVSAESGREDEGQHKEVEGQVGSLSDCESGRSDQGFVGGGEEGEKEREQWWRATVESKDREIALLRQLLEEERKGRAVALSTAGAEVRRLALKREEDAAVLAATRRDLQEAVQMAEEAKAAKEALEQSVGQVTTGTEEGGGEGSSSATSTDQGKEKGKDVVQPEAETNRLAESQSAIARLEEARDAAEACAKMETEKRGLAETAAQVLRVDIDRLRTVLFHTEADLRMALQQFAVTSQELTLWRERADCLDRQLADVIESNEGGKGEGSIRKEGEGRLGAASTDEQSGDVASASRLNEKRHEVDGEEGKDASRSLVEQKDAEPESSSPPPVPVGAGGEEEDADGLMRGGEGDKERPEEGLGSSPPSPAPPSPSVEVLEEALETSKSREDSLLQLFIEKDEEIQKLACRQALLEGERSEQQRTMKRLQVDLSCASEKLAILELQMRATKFPPHAPLSPLSRHLQKNKAEEAAEPVDGKSGAVCSSEELTYRKDSQTDDWADLTVQEEAEGEGGAEGEEGTERRDGEEEDAMPQERISSPPAVHRQAGFLKSQHRSPSLQSRSPVPPLPLARLQNQQQSCIRRPREGRETERERRRGGYDAPTISSSQRRRREPSLSARPASPLGVKVMHKGRTHPPASDRPPQNLHTDLSSRQRREYSSSAGMGPHCPGASTGVLRGLLTPLLDLLRGPGRHLNELREEGLGGEGAKEMEKTREGEGGTAHSRTELFPKLRLGSVPPTANALCEIPVSSASVTRSDAPRSGEPHDATPAVPSKACTGSSSVTKRSGVASRLGGAGGQRNHVGVMEGEFTMEPNRSRKSLLLRRGNSRKGLRERSRWLDLTPTRLPTSGTCSVADRGYLRGGLSSSFRISSPSPAIERLMENSERGTRSASMGRRERDLERRGGNGGGASQISSFRLCDKTERVLQEIVRQRSLRLSQRQLQTDQIDIDQEETEKPKIHPKHTTLFILSQKMNEKEGKPQARTKGTKGKTSQRWKSKTFRAAVRPPSSVLHPHRPSALSSLPWPFHSLSSNQQEQQPRSEETPREGKVEGETLPSHHHALVGHGFESTPRHRDTQNPHSHTPVSPQRLQTNGKAATNIQRKKGHSLPPPSLLQAMPRTALPILPTTFAPPSRHTVGICAPLSEGRKMNQAPPRKRTDLPPPLSARGPPPPQHQHRPVPFFYGRHGVVSLAYSLVSPRVWGPLSLTSPKFPVCPLHLNPPHKLWTQNYKRHPPQATGIPSVPLPFPPPAGSQPMSSPPIVRTAQSISTAAQETSRHKMSPTPVQMPTRQTVPHPPPPLLHARAFTFHLPTRLTAPPRPLPNRSPVPVPAVHPALRRVAAQRPPNFGLSADDSMTSAATQKRKRRAASREGEPMTSLLDALLSARRASASPPAGVSGHTQETEAELPSVSNIVQISDGVPCRSATRGRVCVPFPLGMPPPPPFCVPAAVPSPAPPLYTYAQTAPLSSPTQCTPRGMQLQWAPTPTALFSSPPPPQTARPEVSVSAPPVDAKSAAFHEGNNMKLSRASPVSLSANQIGHRVPVGLSLSLAPTAEDAQQKVPSPFPPALFFPHPSPRDNVGGPMKSTGGVSFRVPGGPSRGALPVPCPSRPPFESLQQALPLPLEVEKEARARAQQGETKRKGPRKGMRPHVPQQASSFHPFEPRSAEFDLSLEGGEDSTPTPKEMEGRSRPSTNRERREKVEGEREETAPPDSHDEAEQKPESALLLAKKGSRPVRTPLPQSSGALWAAQLREEGGMSGPSGGIVKAASSANKKGGPGGRRRLQLKETSSRLVSETPSAPQAAASVGTHEHKGEAVQGGPFVDPQRGDGEEQLPSGGKGRKKRSTGVRKTRGGVNRPAFLCSVLDGTRKGCEKHSERTSEFHNTGEAQGASVEERTLGRINRDLDEICLN
uniref:Uncharacterized protein n=1 Tax=Chromera velia CCMP2878 TaxID=1169474 RepID=A0A0G4GLL8_9ALVE|eukprot:Cvel_22427.t1-p1 / transcript=Cvel_22427.t1 / gene=Cvel_22427 / organism=Chromera_velia_CCMP2878 / gene_product=hypothetical protein / transcript_product=hypothetical protein / location=Cvel_scaffold2202:3484-12832(+) / protein_length=2640 / sequence_SO=supercontig / SO=protein_coding / is_pseudo=false